MDKNTTIGILLILGVLFAWNRYSANQMLAESKVKQAQDSVRLVQTKMDSLANLKPSLSPTPSVAAKTVANDSTLRKQLAGQFGAFSASAVGEEKTEILENELVKIVFTNKGGRIKDVILKNYKKNQQSDENVHLLDDTKNRFEYLLPVNGTNNVKTSDLFFVSEKKDNTLTFKALAGNGKYFEQSYSLSANDYAMDYTVKMENLADVMASGGIPLQWTNYLDKIENNTDYERNYSTAYYKPAEKNPDYCKCTANDSKQPEGNVKWVSHANQFFNTSIISTGNAFQNAKLSTEMLDKTATDLKKVYTEVKIPYNGGVSENFGMKLYAGPNEYKRLEAFKVSLEDIVPYGWSLFGTINRWLVRPIFTFLLGFIGNKGIVILVLTLLVKLIVFPLTWKMLSSQARMTAMKPQLESLKKKYPDDAQKQQMETMKMYQESGVNPLGGCLPMAVQMPLWIALFRFFPASIEFRQASFLWAPDLTSYDSIWNLGFNLPLLGNHISLFTILWVLTTLLYTHYTVKDVDMSANPAMKWMQYAMPFMMMFAFNNYAAGLTCYMLFSNILNITQTLGVKKYAFDYDKIATELAENRKKPKTKSGWSQKLEDAMKQQQAMKDQQQKGNNKK